MPRHGYMDAADVKAGDVLAWADGSTSTVWAARREGERMVIVPTGAFNSARRLSPTATVAVVLG